MSNQITDMSELGDAFIIQGCNNGVIKVNKKVGCVLLSKTRVTDTNQSTVASEMGHSCVQTSRHWGGN